MKTIVASSFLLLVTLTAHLIADADVPKPLAFARYEGMMNRSPFAVATAATPPPQAPNFAKDLYIANAAKLADEGVVTLQSNVDKNLKEYLTTKGPNDHGYSISNIEWSDRVGATKVTITKDGQFATLTFNQALLAQPVGAGGSQPAVPQPQVANTLPATVPGSTAIPTPITSLPVPVATPPSIQNQQSTASKPGAVSNLPTPPPRVRGVIQRNPASAPTPVADDRAQLMQDQ